MNRINLGCGGYPVEGVLNIDLFPPADLTGDFREMEFEDLDEITMYHLLEHLPWVEAPDILGKLRGWLRPGGRLIIEVPDMKQIMWMGTSNPNWVSWVYGVQINEGERHLGGYTLESLLALVEMCEFEVDSARRFFSDHPMRIGFPCLSVTAVR